MRLKVISRSTSEFTRERSGDLQRVFHNYDDPGHRSLETAVEYGRALQAVKRDKIFARPFIGAMDGHFEDITCMAKNPNHLKGIFSGSKDGDIRLWDLATRRTVCQFSPGYKYEVKGLTVSTDGRILVSCGMDKIVRLWNVPTPSIMQLYSSPDNEAKLLEKHEWENAFSAVDHQWDGELFATGGTQVEIWNHNRSQPFISFDWIKDTTISLRFNPGEPNMLAASSGRIITLYDVRLSSRVTKVTMLNKTNSIAWNPMEPMNFTAANEDYNCYSFDARKLDAARCVHKGHVNAVTDIDYSPTGREFVTGSKDESVRIFPYNGGHSREIYHTKRMNSVFCVKFTCDASYVVSGSKDANLRLWKAKASEQLGVLLPRERRKHEYRDALKNRYKHLSEVKRILRHRHLPKAIYKKAARKHAKTDLERKKIERRRAHSAPGSIPRVPLRKERIIQEVE